MLISNLLIASEDTDFLEGLQYFRSSEPEKAATAFSRSNSPRSLYYRHLIALMKGEGEKALAIGIEYLTGCRDENSAIMPYITTNVLNLSDDTAKSEKTTEKLFLSFISRNNTFSYPAINFSLGKLLLRQGKISQAKKAFYSLFPITDWYIIGGFDNTADSGFDRKYPPEKEIDLNKKYMGKDFDIEWRKYPVNSISGIIDLLQVIRPQNWAVAYAFTVINSKEEMACYISCGSDDGIKVWLNGDLVIKNQNGRALVIDQDYAPAKIKKGSNHILLKVAQKGGDWNFIIRFISEQGLPIEFSPAGSEEITTYGLSGSETAYEPQTCPFYEIPSLDEEEKTLKQAIIKLYLNDNKSAAKDFENLIKINAGCWLYHHYLGVAYGRDLKGPRAIMCFKKALSIYPGSIKTIDEIIKYYYDKELFKPAETYIKQCIQLKPSFYPAKLYKALIYAERQWYEKALEIVKKIHSQHPENPWVIYSLSWHKKNMGYKKEAEKHLKKALGRNRIYNAAEKDLLKCYIEQQDYSNALRFMEKSVSRELTPLNTYTSMSSVYMMRKQFSKAKKILKEALQLCPDDSNIYFNLGRIALLEKNEKKTFEYWEKALELRPDYLWLKDYLNDLKPRQKTIFDKYEETDISALSLLSNSPGQEDYPEASAIVLLDKSIIQLNVDGSNTEKTHRIVKILNEKGRTAYSQVSIPYSTSLKLEKAVTITSEGEEHEATEIKGGKISFPVVNVGATIEYKYSINRYSGGWLDQHYYETWIFQDWVPVLKSEYILALPKGMDIVTHLSSDKIKHTVENFNGYDVNIWKTKNLPEIYHETDSPPIQDLTAKVMVSTILSWDELARWQNSLIDGQFDMDEKIRETVEQIISGTKDRKEIIRRIYEYLVTEIRYLYTGEGIFGKKPHNAINIFANRYGDCKDKATLMIAMLKESGIKSYYAGLPVRGTGQVIKSVPCPQTNHIIVYIPDSDKKGTPMFVDPTSRYLPFDILPAGDQNVDALILKRPGYEFIRTPVEPPDKSTKTHSFDMKIDENGNMLCSSKLTGTGEFASTYRNMFRAPGKRPELLEKSLNSIIRGAHLVEYDFKNFENIQPPVKIECIFSAPNFARQSGDELRIPSFNNFKIAQTFALKSKRHYAIYMDGMYTRKYENIYRAPDSYQTYEVPDDISLDCGYMSFSSKYNRGKDYVKNTKILVIKSLKIPREDYKKFRNFCIEVDRAEEREISFKKSPVKNNVEINPEKGKDTSLANSES